MSDTDQLWMDSYGFVYSADGKRMLKGANVEGSYWIPEGMEEIEPGALIGCKIGTLHVPWTAHVYRIDEHGVAYSLDGHRLLSPLRDAHHTKVGVGYYRNLVALEVTARQ